MQLSRVILLALTILAVNIAVFYFVIVVRRSDTEQVLQGTSRPLPFPGEYQQTNLFV